MCWLFAYREITLQNQIHIEEECGYLQVNMKCWTTRHGVYLHLDELSCTLHNFYSHFWTFKFHRLIWISYQCYAKSGRLELFLLLHCTYKLISLNLNLINLYPAFTCLSSIKSKYVSKLIFSQSNYVHVFMLTIGKYDSDERIYLQSNITNDEHHSLQHQQPRRQHHRQFKYPPDYSYTVFGNKNWKHSSFYGLIHSWLVPVTYSIDFNSNRSNINYINISLCPFG